MKFEGMGNQKLIGIALFLGPIIFIIFCIFFEAHFVHDGFVGSVLLGCIEGLGVIGLGAVLYFLYTKEIKKSMYLLSGILIAWLLYSSFPYLFMNVTEAISGRIPFVNTYTTSPGFMTKENLAKFYNSSRPVCKGFSFLIETSFADAPERSLCIGALIK